MKKITIERDDLGILLICALRYCQGRQTYMPALVQDIARKHLDKLSDKDIAVMLNDCATQERLQLFGDEKIDKPGWIHWRADLVREQIRRNDNTEAKEGE